jgi:hypothetical protein
MCGQILVKLPCIKFNENPFSGSRIVTYGLTDKAKPISSFSQLPCERASASFPCDITVTQSGTIRRHLGYQPRVTRAN